MRTIAILLVVLAACSGGSTPPPSPPTPTTQMECTDPQPTPAHVCTQDCGPPVAREGDPPPPWRWLSPEEVEARDRGGCPRCLPPWARIATPEGDVAIADLALGARVFTIDEAGRRQVGVVVRMGSTVIRGAHHMLRVTLADGRVVTASPEHPVGDGRSFAMLAVGARLDASTVRSVERVTFAGDRTWDLLPSGPTGLYIADGVVMGSTLSAR